MRLVSPKTPAPRLLSTVVPPVRERPAEEANTKSRLKGAPLFSGNGRAIFIGIALGAVLLSAISVIYARRQAARQRAEAERPFVAVSTQSISRPEPIVVKISADLIHVSAISMGHPRMAIINGRLVGEGEQITIQTPPASVAVSLQVVRIADGQIQLSDGTQLITARLEVAATQKPKP
jgi:hypothetical protein